jgi:L-alanine-DL-glutamate epimerase-like enolase superfamily enzyme
MKLTGITVTPHGRASPAALCSVELQTDAGLAGVAVMAQRHRSAVEKLFKALLQGQEPGAVTGLWEKMQQARGARAEARAALDLALWDLKAKANQEPLWKTLGGARPRANAHAASASALPSDRALAQWTETVVRAQGFRGARLQLAGDGKRDAWRLGLVREAMAAVTRSPALMVRMGANAATGEVLRRVRRLERTFDLTWVEHAAPDRAAGVLKRVADGIYGAVCAGGTLEQLDDFLVCLRHRAADVMQLDIGRIGISGAMQVADAAFGYELPVTLCAVPGNVHAHAAGAMPMLMSVEILDPAPGNAAFTTDVHIENGWAVAGDLPGNGIVLARRGRR